MSTEAYVPDKLRADVATLWKYHNMGHTLRPADIAIGLGSHDPGVATYTAELYHQGLFPRVVFTGANAPTTIERFPRGEAVHYREMALELGVPDEAILIETQSTTTRENFDFTRKLLADKGIAIETAIVVSRPYQQRRAYATAKKAWPELTVICASQPLPLDTYVAGIGDADRVINMLVGDTQRIALLPGWDIAIPQEMPAEAETAYQRLVDAGFTSRLI